MIVSLKEFEYLSGVLSFSEVISEKLMKTQKGTYYKKYNNKVKYLKEKLINAKIKEQI